MKLDEAINHAEEVAEEQAKKCEKCAEEHRQLAEWLRDYKRLLEQQPCEDWQDVPSNEMNLEQARQSVRDLRKFVMDNHILPKLLPCEDVVSRKQALIGIRNLYPGIPFTRQNVKKWKEDNKKYFECENVIRDLPSVAPKTNWIPVSERLPDDEQMVLVCSNTGNIEVSCGSRSTEIKDKFIWYTSGWKFGEVAAWMPLPEPYQEE